MDPSNCETTVLYQKIQPAASDKPVTDAFFSINIDGLFKQGLCPSFLEIESDGGPPPSSLLLPQILHSHEGRNFGFDLDVKLSERGASIVHDSSCSLKGILVEATSSADNEKSNRTDCGFRVQNVHFEFNDLVEESEEDLDLKEGSKKDCKIELSASSPNSPDITFRSCVSKSDSSGTIRTSVMLPFIDHVQIENIPCHPGLETCSNSILLMQSSTTPSVHDLFTETKMDLRDKISNSCEQCVSENQISNGGDLSNKKKTNRSSSSKRPKTEVAPGWRKPPRPPRQTKPELNSLHSNSVSDALHTYTGEKNQRLYGKKKPKAESYPPNLVLGLALVFTFCFCLLIASSRR